MTLANFQNSLSRLAPASINKSASSPAGIMSPGLGPAELLRNCLLDWAPSGANKKRPPGLGPGSFPKKLQWGPVFLCQIEYGSGAGVDNDVMAANDVTTKTKATMVVRLHPGHLQKIAANSQKQVSR